jgi:putative secretion ATPase (PEP-CTERM system associated)
MYTEFYKLDALPFRLTPDPRFFYSSSVHARAMAHLTFGLSQGEGFIVITGDVGAGKTTLIDHLMATLGRDRLVTASLATTQLDDQDTLLMIGDAFGLRAGAGGKAGLLSELKRFLSELHAVRKRAVLFVDEAQTLSMLSLEELRMLSNFKIDGTPPFQGFLLGQPQFKRILARPELDQLRQRVIAAYHLGPLGRDETRAYIEHRLRTAGWAGDPVFADSAFDRIFTAAGGVPRRINLLCGRLMMFGFLEAKHRFEASDVDAVAADMEADTASVTAGAGSAAPEREPTDRFAARLDALEHRLTRHERILRHLAGIRDEFGGPDDERSGEA